MIQGTHYVHICPTLLKIRFASTLSIHKCVFVSTSGTKTHSQPEHTFTHLHIHPSFPALACLEQNPQTVWGDYIAAWGPCAKCSSTHIMISLQLLVVAIWLGTGRERQLRVLCLCRAPVSQRV